MIATTLQRPQLGRLLQIVTALQSDRRPNARQLAEECEVSRRTIFRDLETIEASGLPVEYDAARQGYRLAGPARIRAQALDEREVLAIALLVNRGLGLGPFGLAAPARAGFLKLLADLPEPSRRRVEALDLATVAAARMPRPEPSRLAVHERLLDALIARVRVRLTIREPGGEPESTRLDPYRLLHGRDGWSVVGRSSLHRRVRRIPLAYISDATPTDDPATIPPRFRDDRRPGPCEVHLRFDAVAAPSIRDGQWHPSQRLDPLPDGRLDLRLDVDRPGDLAAWVVGHGEHVEVLAPARLRESARRLAVAAARRHARPRPAIALPPEFGGPGG